MECTHLLDNVKLDSDLFGEDSSITKNFNCSECGVHEQNWICLHCGVVNCGRYANGHAQLHAVSSDHQICMSCDVYSVYCYKCDDYISNDTDHETIHKIRQGIMQVTNNENVESNTDLEQSNSNEEQNSPVTNQLDPSEKSAILEETGTEATATSSCDIPSTIPESNENKPSKITKNVEEHVRSLRPRSRKRSHSGDSSSTENSNQPRGKEKKVSYNGKSQREKKIVGLKNLGNTCFMNAVLQSLNNIQEFSCYFSQLPSLEMKTNGRKVYHSRSYTRQEMHDVVMAEELRKVLINLNTGGCGSKGAISPECLFLVIWKVVPRFRGYQQQDAHEFLRYMLDRLHTELLQLLPPDRAEGGFVPRAPSASIVTAVFGGTLQSEVRCLACGTESKKFDPFLDLSLELPETGRHDAPVSLTDCLTSFVQVEELADTERYHCSACKGKQKSTKQFRIRRLPNVLCLHLKRFRWHNYFRTKVDTNISFPLSALDMSRFVLSNVPDTRRSGLGNYLYDLAAVIVHHGSGGHKHIVPAERAGHVAVRVIERARHAPLRPRELSLRPRRGHRAPRLGVCDTLYYTCHGTKVDTNISFPLSALDMSRFVLSNVPDTRRSGLGNYLYDLAAVIVHHGSGAGSGHYTAFAINEDQWFHFNDQTVRETDVSAVASCKPYILFYIRREFSLPSAS